MKSHRIYLVLLALVMLATLRHSAYVYMSISPVKFESHVLNWIYAVCVVSVMDLVVIVFSYEGRKRLPMAYAIGLGILSGLYFLNYGPVTSVVGSLVFMVLIPLAGYEFAELFTAKRTATDADRTRSEDLTLMEAKLQELTDEMHEIHDKHHVVLTTLIEAMNETRNSLRTVADDAAKQAEAALSERFRKRLERLEKKMGKGGEDEQTS